MCVISKIYAVFIHNINFSDIIAYKGNSQCIKIYIINECQPQSEKCILAPWVLCFQMFFLHLSGTCFIEQGAIKQC